MIVLLRHWVKFNIVGIAGTGVQLTILTALITGFGVHYLLATLLGVEAAIVHNFLWHEHWTWADRRKRGHVAHRFIQFNLANGTISIAGNLVLMGFFISTVHLHYIAANIIAITACSLFNFMVSDRVVF